MKATLRDNRGDSYPGVIRSGRRGLRWRRRWSLIERRARWSRVTGCTAGRYRAPGLDRHAHRLVVEFDGRYLEVLCRGPWCAIGLVELCGQIRERAGLDDSQAP